MFIKIFLLETLQRQDKFKNVIIWSDDINTARKNSGHFGMAGPKGTTEPEGIKELTFYTEEDNATCRELNTDECKRELDDKDDNVLYAEFQGKNYQLKKNEPESIE